MISVTAKVMTDMFQAQRNLVPPCANIDGVALDDAESRQQALTHCNELLGAKNAEERIAWALERLPGHHVLSSSFGATAAVSLSLLTRVRPDIPVVLIDTGYLFPETYQFIDQLTERLDLNLQVYRARFSPAWQEQRYGKRWEQGKEGLDAYHRDNKIEPMERALEELQVGTWFAGLRRNQSSSRAGLPVLQWLDERWKVHPIIDWNDRDVYEYLKREQLPYHPLWDQGYVSIGDVHSTKPLHQVEHIDETRFFGWQRECGLHEIGLAPGKTAGSA